MGESFEKTQGPYGGSSDSSRVLFECTVSVQEHFSQKNAKTIGWRRTGRATGGSRRKAGLAPFIRSTTRSQSAKNLLLLSLQDRARASNIREPITVPVRVLLSICTNKFFTAKGQVSLKSGDLDNLIQGPIDCLVKAGILKDDGLIVELTAIKRFGEENQVHLLILNSTEYAPSENTPKKKRQSNINKP